MLTYDNNPNEIAKGPKFRPQIKKGAKKIVRVIFLQKL
jgi:hypothetical protein